jgi:alpha-L-fucosidase
MARASASDRDRRLGWFNAARFGMFIHWGVYAIPAQGEWVLYQERIPPEEYARLAQQFHPRKFDAGDWVALASRAGMKYMVLTTRHHDGFSLFDSKVSDFTSVKTAAKRDFVAEYVRACRRAGLKIGFYYSLLDWSRPAYFAGPQKDPRGWERFVEYVHAQVRELCTQYGRIDLLWYDGSWPHDAEAWQSRRLNAMVRRLQPHILINDRSGRPEDFDTPEQHVTASASGRAWESCMTIGEYSGWGYIRHNRNLRSVTQLIQHLVFAASGGGNYLLNVGPKPDGAVQREFVTRLERMGDWLKVNGESIYGTQRCPFGAASIGVTTCRGNTAYVHVFRWPGETACVAGVGNRVKSARVLATGQTARVEQRGDRLFLDLPKNPPDPHDSVIALELVGEPRAC